jgi:hypothetical protein
LFTAKCITVRVNFSGNLRRKRGVKVAEFCRAGKAFYASNPSKYGHLQAILLEDARIY